MRPAPVDQAPIDPLIVEAMKKAAVAWLTVAHHPPYAVWCVWANDAVYVVSGPGEQAAPGLARARRATVTARGDHGGRIATWSAVAHRVMPGSAEWDAVAPQVAAKRLNSSGAPELANRWASTCTLTRLAPAQAQAVPSA